MLVHKDAALFKTKVIFSLNVPAILLIILYQLTRFEAPNFIDFQGILITSLQCPNLQRAITRTNRISFKNNSPGNQFTIIYHLTEFETPKYNSCFQCPNLQKPITEKKNFLF